MMFWISSVTPSVFDFPLRLLQLMGVRGSGVIGSGVCDALGGESLTGVSPGAVAAVEAVLAPPAASGEPLVAGLEPLVRAEIARADVVVIVVSASFLTHSAGDCFCFDLQATGHGVPLAHQRPGFCDIPFAFKEICRIALRPAADRIGSASGLITPITSIVDRLEGVCRTLGERIAGHCADLLPPHKMPLSAHGEWQGPRFSCVCSVLSMGGGGLRFDRCSAIHLVRWSAAGAGIALGADVSLAGARLALDPLSRWAALGGPLSGPPRAGRLGIERAIDLSALPGVGANAMPPQRMSPPPVPPPALGKRKKKATGPLLSPLPADLGVAGGPSPTESKEEIGKLEAVVTLSPSKDAPVEKTVVGSTRPLAETPEPEIALPSSNDPMGLSIFDHFKGHRPADPALRLSLCDIVRNLERAQPGCLARSLEDEDAGRALLCIYRGGKRLN